MAVRAEPVVWYRQLVTAGRMQMLLAEDDVRNW